jgi:hypothetical protein
MVPLALYGLEFHFDFFSETKTGDHYAQFYRWIDGKWIYMELATIVAGILAFYFYPFSFISVPVFVAAWFLSMDIAAFIIAKEISYDYREWISLFFGLALIALGFVFDRNKKEELGYWSYLFGTLSFWLGLNALVWLKGEFVLFFYLLINLIMMLLSIILKRRVLMLFGAFGLFAYLAHLAFDLFRDSILLPFALSFVGLILIYLGIVYQRNQKRIESKIEELFPWFNSKSS